jgi:hypothetical protein
MNNRKRKRKVMAQFHHELSIRHLSGYRWTNLKKREQAMQSLTLLSVSKALASFSAAFDLPAGWSP